MHCSAYTDHGHSLMVDMLICAFAGSMTVMAAKGLAMFLRTVRFSLSPKIRTRIRSNTHSVSFMTMPL